MQQLNYNETNGIVIGPEFSRIFSELILQAIDRSLFQNLKKDKIIHERDYEIYRYVDDYFVFYNDDKTKDKILELLQFSLKEFKLYLNPNKEVIYEKPLITEITIAKNKIKNLISEKLKYNLEEIDEGVGTNDSRKKLNGTIYIRYTKLITEFKTIIKESNITYADILNYTFSIIERKCFNIVRDYALIEKKENSEKQFANAILAVLEFMFFIYSVSPRVNTTLKLSRILNLITSFFKTRNVSYDYKHIVFKRIYDNIWFLLSKNENSKHTQVETLYLLLVLNELGKEYWLDRSILCRYFKIENINDKLKFNIELNYFSITILLFYMRNKQRYSDIRMALEDHIVDKFKGRSKFLKKDTELTFLLFDTLSCPYVTKELKRQLLSLHGVDENLQDSIIQYRKYWFTKWSKFDFGKALDAKRSDDVY